MVEVEEDELVELELVEEIENDVELIELEVLEKEVEVLLTEVELEVELLEVELKLVEDIEDEVELTLVDELVELIEVEEVELEVVEVDEDVELVEELVEDVLVLPLVELVDEEVLEIELEVLLMELEVLDTDVLEVEVVVPVTAALKVATAQAQFGASVRVKVAACTPVRPTTILSAAPSISMPPAAVSRLEKPVPAETLIEALAATAPMTSSFVQVVWVVLPEFGLLPVPVVPVFLSAAPLMATPENS